MFNPQAQRQVRSSLGVSRSRGSDKNVVFKLAIVLGVLALVVLILYVKVMHSVVTFQRASNRNERPIEQKTLIRDSELKDLANKVEKKTEIAAKQVEKEERPKQPDDQVHAEVKGETATADSPATTATEHVLIKTSQGDIKVLLRPDLSKESVDYIRAVAAADRCSPCNIYRAEKPGILQGVMRSPKLEINQVKGGCPAGFEHIKNHCPAWDKKCGCHGPIMTRGFIGWAAGDTGPDFFIDLYKRPGEWWGTQHTLWGEIQEEESLKIADSFFDLPAKEIKGMTHIAKPVHFELEIVK